MRLITLIGLMIFLQVRAQSPFDNSDKYHKARIYITNIKDLLLLANQGVPVDHGVHKQHTYFESDFSERELQKVKMLGFEYDIVINDVQEFYISRNEDNKTQTRNAGCSGSSSDYQVPANFSLGSMGGFLTYNQYIQAIDAMVAQYPNLITAKAPIAGYTTEEGRPIYWMKISDNPNVDEAEPEMMYNAIHHAREPGALSQLIFYMWYLLENYDTDAEIKAIVDNTEMYFVPLVNPDGYVYNVTNNPSGGGMWRKNRKDNGDGTVGVDPNRNYSYQWGTSGVSFNGNDDTFPGDSGFSEIETQAMKWFCEQHQFVLNLNYHTYGDLLLYPHSYANAQTPDNDLFVAISGMMVAQNGFTNQLSADLYPSSGDADDWMYTDVSTHNKIMSMTPEVGGDFWPASNTIIDLCKSTMFQNITAAHLITNYAVANELTGTMVSATQGYFKYDLQRLGMADPGNFIVSLVPVSSNLVAVGNSNQHNGMLLQEMLVDSISYTLNNSITSGELIKFVLTVDNGQYISQDTITKVYGVPYVLIFENGDNTSGWQVTGDWGVSTQSFYSAGSSITDSPVGNYSNGANTSITYSNDVVLTDVLDAQVSFYSRWSIENNFDYVQFQISVDGGQSWIPQCGKYTNSGSQNQDQGEPLYDGVQNAWVKEEISLSSYIGQTIKMRFILKADMGVTSDGFYFDDFAVETVSLNHVNSADQVVLEAVYPNPCSDYITLKTADFDEGLVEVQIYNTLGSQVLSNQINITKNGQSFSVQELSQGVYYLRLKQGEKVSTSKKIMVMRTE